MRVREALLAGPLGFGTAPLGNMYRDIPEDEALATVDAAWDAGTRFFDTAPFYGAGLAEIRLGKALSKRPRGEYVLSSKVGRLTSTRPKIQAAEITVKRARSSNMAVPTKSFPTIRLMAP
jgi:aryl-alcohol dehydrogenase-like predicted oxidoreductase